MGDPDAGLSTVTGSLMISQDDSPTLYMIRHAFNSATRRTLFHPHSVIFTRRV